MRISGTSGILARDEDTAHGEVLSQPPLPAALVFHVDGHRELAATGALHPGHERNDRSPFLALRGMAPTDDPPIWRAAM